MDPYKVLGVTPQTSDDDVKRAYRELARKYHPDNYAGNPLADLAEARMKEINEAYDLIMNERSGRQGQGQGQSGPQYGYGSDSGQYGQGGSGQYSYGYGNGSDRQQYSSSQQQAYSGENANLYTQVRRAINQGNLSMAETLLQRVNTQDAEWYFLMGTVYYRKGWYDDAGRAYTQACSMDPNNVEYRTALSRLNMSAGYGGYRPMSEAGLCDCCMYTMCLNCCMQSCCGGGC